MFSICLLLIVCTRTLSGIVILSTHAAPLPPGSLNAGTFLNEKRYVGSGRPLAGVESGKSEKQCTCFRQKQKK